MLIPDDKNKHKTLMILQMLKITEEIPVSRRKQEIV